MPAVLIASFVNFISPESVPPLIKSFAEVAISRICSVALPEVTYKSFVQTKLDVNGITRATTYFANGGTASNPAYTFTSAIGSVGMYAPANNTLGFVTGGAESMRIDPSGNVGIGSSNPSEKLVVSGNITASGKICDSVGCIGAGGGEWTKLGSGDLYNTDLGNVGIGVTNPQAKLDVNGGIKIGSVATCNSSAEGVIRYNSTKNDMEFCSGTSWLSVGAGYGGTYQMNGGTCTSVNSITSSLGCACPAGYTVVNAGYDTGNTNVYYLCIR